VATPVSVQESEKHTPPPPDLRAGQKFPTTPLVEQASKGWLLQIYTTSLGSTPRHKATAHRTNSTNFTFFITTETEFPVNFFIVVYL
jgi:hypothetical protein